MGDFRKAWDPGWLEGEEAGICGQPAEKLQRVTIGKMPQKGYSLKNRNPLIILVPEVGIEPT